ncbi:ribose 5-phosphate isomerase B [Mediterraneibacter sp. NSJ-55]|uniref:Ribose 5-phosphate isomerase B n=1 Tax=Mediterraneibacter hominis TaxID=2763054 RepID=A0A923LHT6_9FIRM|nr:ribose 5-phosphate isomerase B [Mediterraneibacter hominis]MBC5688535.1 ribose 5-phosphate isomerase B [Mediterraneibacter hominis]
MKIAIGCDEAAYELKVVLEEYLDKKKIEWKDFGAQKGEKVLYPDVAERVCMAILSKECERGILVCGTGIGMAISANKIPGIRAAVCHDAFSAERARKSNNAQILCMGERVIGFELAKTILDIWLKCDFTGGASLPKVERIEHIEKKYRI